MRYSDFEDGEPDDANALTVWQSTVDFFDRHGETIGAVSFGLLIVSIIALWSMADLALELPQ